MGVIESPESVQVFIAVLYRPDINCDRIQDIVSQEFGAIEKVYGPVEFTWSTYYEKEMGKNLKKLYCITKRRRVPDELPDIKNASNALEKRFADAQNRRSMNCDPGYLTYDKLVLATTKNHFHRLYLGKGIYGEVTLHFQRGKFRYFSWTYPDYREPSFCSFLSGVRASLRGGANHRLPPRENGPESTDTRAGS